jgi:hypothetical protein
MGIQLFKCLAGERPFLQLSAMSKVGQPVEWSFGKVCSLFALLI